MATIMTFSRFLVASATLLVPHLGWAQSTKPKWEVGGYTLSLGDGQQETINKLVPIYSVNFDPARAVFHVRCKNGETLGSNIAALKFKANRLDKIYSFEEANCLDSMGIASDDATTAMDLLVKTVRKMKTLGNQDCRIVDMSGQEKDTIYMVCGAYHSIQFVANTQKKQYGFLVTVEYLK